MYEIYSDPLCGGEVWSEAPRNSIIGREDRCCGETTTAPRHINYLTLVVVAGSLYFQEILQETS